MHRRTFLAATAAAFAAPAAARATQPVITEKTTIVLGDDAFVRDAWRELRGRAIGIVTNPSGVSRPANRCPTRCTATPGSR